MNHWSHESAVFPRRFQCFLLISALVLCPIAAPADTLDLSLVSRFGDRDSLIVTVALDVLFMGINYALNFLFIGYPAMRLGKISRRDMALDILFLTLAGQFADRVGAIAAGIVAGPQLSYSINWHPLDWSLASFFFLLNFLFSALAVGALVVFFGSRRWHLPMKAKWGIALLAAIFTNPAYVMIIEVWRYQKFLASIFTVRPA